MSEPTLKPLDPKESSNNSLNSGSTPLKPIVDQKPLSNQGGATPTILAPINPKPIDPAKMTSEIKPTSVLPINVKQQTPPSAPSLPPLILPISNSVKASVNLPQKPPAGAEPLNNKSQKTGNLFTRLFKESKVENKSESIIDAIVNKQEAEKTKERDLKKAAEEAKKQLKKPSDGLFFYRFSRVFFQFTLLFISLGTLFLYIQVLDTNNSILNWFNGPRNYASQLHEAQSQLNVLEKQEKEIKGEVTRFKKGYNDPNEALVKKIAEDRQEWPEVLAQLKGAAEMLYPLNYFSGYLKYTNFNVNFETGQVAFTASLSDPSGNNFTALADFENILRVYPAKPGESEGIKPYFKNIQDINNYSERYDANTDSYETVFSMNVTINKDLL